MYFMMHLVGNPLSVLDQVAPGFELVQRLTTGRDYVVHFSIFPLSDDVVCEAKDAAHSSCEGGARFQAKQRLTSRNILFIAAPYPYVQEDRFRIAFLTNSIFQCPSFAFDTRLVGSVSAKCICELSNRRSYFSEIVQTYLVLISMLRPSVPYMYVYLVKILILMI